MSQLDALLARSKEPGQFVERKSFSLARNKAIEKMREFTLRHPEQYILELVQAAVFAEASWIAIDVSPNAILLGYIGGKLLSQTELNQLFDYLFVDQTHRPTRHLMQVAIGVNALLQRKPSLIRIESGNGVAGETARLDLGGDGEGTVGSVKAALAGTYVYAEFNVGWRGRFASSIKVSDETDLVERNCIYTPTPILLNGAAPFGYTGRAHVQLFGMTTQQAIREQHRRGSVGLIKNKSVASEFRLVVGGVWITSQMIPLLGEGVAGVICDDALRKTADMSDIVQEDQYLEMLHAVQPLVSQMILKNDSSYVAPALPAKPTVVQSSGNGRRPAAPQIKSELLPSVVEQLGARHSILLVHLPHKDSRSLLFWVTPTDAKHLIEVANPLDFPHIVLVLTVGQALTLEQMEAKQGARRLTRPEDVGFVVRALERRVEIHEVDVPSEALTHGVLSCTLRHHLVGPEPHWGADNRGVPTYIEDAKGEVHLLCLPLALPHVSVVARWGEAFETPGSRTDTGAQDTLENLHHLAERAVMDSVMREAWRLIQDDTNERGRTLAASLVALNCTPFFVHVDGGLELSVGFPSRWWSEHVDRVKRWPLADLGSAPFTLERFTSLQGTNTVLDIDHGLLSELSALEERLGWGHLHAPVHEGQFIVVWFKRGQHWHRADSLLEVGRCQAFIGLQPTLKTKAADVYRVVPWAIPGIMLAQSGDADLSEAEWRKGLERAMMDLASAELAPDTPKTTQGWWSFERAFATEARVRALGGLALLGIAATLEKWDLPVVRSTGGGLVSLGDVRSGRVEVAPLHGVYVDAENVVQLSYDELQVLRRNKVPVSLYLDDSPDVWRDLKAPSDGWLFSQVLRIPGLTGRIGFRFPYDGSQGILLESSRAFHALSHQAVAVPCHGLVDIQGGLEGLSAMQGKLLSLAALQLVQALLECLMNEEDPKRRAAAMSYGRDYVESLWRTQNRKLTSKVALQLAELITLKDVSGEEIRLSQWLAQQSVSGSTETEPIRTSDTPKEGGASYRNPDRVIRRTLQFLKKHSSSPQSFPRVNVMIEEAKGVGLGGSRGQGAALFEIKRVPLGVNLAISGVRLTANANHRLFERACTQPLAMNLLAVELTRTLSTFFLEHGGTLETSELMKRTLMDQIMREGLS